MLKCSSERWVWAPHNLSAGTATSPRLSVSLRTSVMGCLDEGVGGDANKRDRGAEGRYAGVMIQCIRLWTGDDGESHFEQGLIELESGSHGDLLSGKMPATTVSLQETASGGTLDWHTAPVRQLVITLSGTLDFQTRAKQHF